MNKRCVYKPKSMISFLIRGQYRTNQKALLVTSECLFLFLPAYPLANLLFTRLESLTSICLFVYTWMTRSIDLLEDTGRSFSHVCLSVCQAKTTHHELGNNLNLKHWTNTMVFSSTYIFIFYICTADYICI